MPIEHPEFDFMKDEKPAQNVEQSKKVEVKAEATPIVKKEEKIKSPKTVSTKARTNTNDPSCWNGRADCGFQD